VGSAPSGIATGDLDGDGDVDMVVANEGGNTVTVLVNNGTGTAFSSIVLSNVPSPRGIALGDVNGDGRLDILCTSPASNSVVVLVAEGGLTYTNAAQQVSAYPSAPFVCGAEPTGLAVGDVDGDGDVDVVTANAAAGAGGNSASVLLNRPAPSILVQPQPLDLGAVVLGTVATQPFVLSSSDIVDSVFVRPVGGDITLGFGVMGFSTQATLVYPQAQPLVVAPVLPFAGSGAVRLLSSGALGARSGTFIITTRGMQPLSAVWRAIIMPTGIAIFTVTPDAGAPGSPLEVTGANLNGTQTAELVLPDGSTVPAPFVVTSSTTMTVIVPPMPTTVTSAVLRISDPSGSTSATTRFVVLHPPTITGLIPVISTGSTIPVSSVPPMPPVQPMVGMVNIAVGAPMIITGTNFSTGSTVSFGGVDIPARVLSPTQISIEVPALLPVGVNASSATIRVSTPGGVATTTQTLTVVPPPVITGLSSYAGVTGGTITIFGVNLQDVVSVRFGTTATQVLSNTPSSVEIRIPPNSDPREVLDAVRRITVTVATGGVATTATRFAYSSPGVVPPPTILGIDPTVGSTGNVVTITGMNLGGGVVTVGGLPAMVLLRTDMEIRVLVPSGIPPKATTANVVVTTSGGRDSSRVPFRVVTPVPPPVIVSVGPPTARAGEFVTVTGANLTQTSQVFIGDTPARFVVVSPTEVRVFVPSTSSTASATDGARGVISIRTPSGVTTSTLVLNQPQAPVITGFTPNRDGRDSAGVAQTVTITGVNLQNVTSLTIGGIALTNIVIESPTRIRATLPPHDGLGSGNDNRASRQMAAPVVVVAADVAVRSERLFEFGVSLQGDSLALVGVFEQTNPRGLVGNPAGTWRNTRGWLTTTQLEGWTGVEVTNNRVVVLNLANNGLQGTLPSGIGNLTGLRRLNLSGNGLGGLLPESLGNLRLLEEVNLSQNSLAADSLVLGQMVCSWRNVRLINLSSNQIRSEIPLCVGTLTRLEVLDLRQNQFYGTLPPTMANLRRLEVLRLGRNALVGGIPHVFGLPGGVVQPLEPIGTVSSVSASSAKAVSQASISSGEPVRSTAAMASLRVLELNSNRFSGVLAAELGNLTTLERIVLDSNLLGGVMPVNFRNLRSLKHLSLRKNEFVALPDMTVIRALDTLDVAENRLDFGSVEPHLAIDRYRYSPQDSIGRRVDTSLALGQPLRVWASGGGTASRYQWYKLQQRIDTLASGVRQVRWQAEVLPDERDSVLELFAVSPADTGRYECRVTNRLAVGLALVRRAVDVRLSGEGISGTLVGTNTIDFGRVPVGDTVQQRLVVTNRTARAVTVVGLSLEALPSTEQSFVVLDGGRVAREGVVLRPFGSAVVPVAFTPRRVGDKRAAVVVQYFFNDARSEDRSVRQENALRGWAQALKAVAVDFDTVRVGRRTLATGFIINRGERVATIRQMGLFNRTGRAFSADEEVMPMVLAAGDTAAVVVQCRAESGLLEGGSVNAVNLVGVLRYEADVDTAEAAVTAVARLPRVDDVVLVPRVRPTADSLGAGSLVGVEVSIAQGDRRRIFAAAQPEWSGLVVIDKNVLALDGSERRVRRLGSSDPRAVVRDRGARWVIPPARWDGRDSVLVRVWSRVVSGDTGATTIRIAGLQWGKRPRAAGEAQVFVEEPENGEFRASLCRSVVVRLTRISTAVSLSVVHPNPVVETAEVSYGVREQGVVTLGLYDAVGKQVAEVLSGEHEPGEYTVQMDVRSLPNGAYTLVLTTANDRRSQPLRVLR
jgi:Leucine-rich repeat (LRR) protein